MFTFPVLGLFSQYRFRSGWGDGGRTLAEQGGWGIFLARFGFTLLPVTCGALAWALGSPSVRLLADTRLDLFGFLMVAFLLAGLGCGVWAVEEYRHPSSWRRRPAWLADFERTTDQ